MNVISITKAGPGRPNVLVEGGEYHSLESLHIVQLSYYLKKCAYHKTHASKGQ